MITLALGIDVSELKFDACLVREGGKLRQRVSPTACTRERDALL